MKTVIIGAGAVGRALANAFARSGVEVAIASRRPPEDLAATGFSEPAVRPETLDRAVTADIILLAVPFAAHRDVAALATDWTGKIIVDATNAFGIDPTELEGFPSSVIVSRAFRNAALVRAFNHLPAKILAEDPQVGNGRRVVFLSSDDPDATARVSELTERLGFAPVLLGALGQGGLLIQASGRTWGPLMFQNLAKAA